ncbi:MAG: hypothetical protein ACR2KG_02345 [Nocardioidaceae bacterium]
MHSVEPEKRGWPRVPFVGIAETYILRPLRQLRMPMHDIARAAQIVREEFTNEYARQRGRSHRRRSHSEAVRTYDR